MNWLTQQANGHHSDGVPRATVPCRHEPSAVQQPAEQAAQPDVWQVRSEDDVPRTPLRTWNESRLGFFDLDDGLTLVGSAIQAGVMRELDLMALRTDGHARRGHAQFLGTPRVASFP